MQTQEKSFIAFIVNDRKSDYTVMLVNPTEKHYSRVVTLTGAYISIDEDLLETSKAVKERGELPPMSAINIESCDIDGLEFTIWYHVDLYEKDTVDPWHVWFILPRVTGALSGYKPEKLPVISSQGVKIELEPCKERNIEEEIKGLNMESKYWKHGE